MKNYINNVPIRSGEITVIMHPNAETVTHHACRLAQAARDHELGVVLLNCATSGQRFAKTADKYITTASRNRTPCVYMRTMERGNLADERTYVESFLDVGTNVLIITGWEWTSSSWRRKERLLYLLREWAERLGIAIVIYSQARTAPTLGEYDRGGIGKLAMIAYAIQSIDGIEATSNILKPPPLILTEEEAVLAERSAQLLARNINDLPSVRLLEADIPDAAAIMNDHKEFDLRPLSVSETEIVISDLD